MHVVTAGTYNLSAMHVPHFCEVHGLTSVYCTTTFTLTDARAYYGPHVILTILVI